MDSAVKAKDLVAGDVLLIRAKDGRVYQNAVVETYQDIIVTNVCSFNYSRKNKRFQTGRHPHVIWVAGVVKILSVER